MMLDKIFTLCADADGREKMRQWIVRSHPSIEVTTVARSILSRPIDAYFVGKGSRYILLVGGHHALESVTVNVTYMILDALLSPTLMSALYGIDCKLLLTKYRFIIIPCVNPDGIEIRCHGADGTPLYDRLIRMSGGDFSTWQANARGVDINHNYDARFGEYKLVEKEMGIVPGPTLYSGEYPESEPETKGVASLVRTLDPAAVVSLHSQGEEIYAYPDTPAVRRVARRLSELTGYTLSAPEGTASYTGLCDYTASLGIPSFTLEVGRGVNPLPESAAKDIFLRIGRAMLTLPTLL